MRLESGQLKQNFRVESAFSHYGSTPALMAMPSLEESSASTKGLPSLTSVTSRRSNPGYDAETSLKELLN